MNFTPRHNEIIVRYLVCESHVNSVESNGHFLTTVKLIKHYFQYFWSLLMNMEHNLYDNDTDDYYDDDSDTLIMDLSYICDKSYDSEEEN